MVRNSFVFFIGAAASVHCDKTLVQASIFLVLSSTFALHAWKPLGEIRLFRHPCAPTYAHRSIVTRVHNILSIPVHRIPRGAQRIPQFIRMSGGVKDSKTGILTGSCTVPVTVNCAFDGGNIQVVNAEDCTSALGVQVKVRDDPYTEFERKTHKQWFYFRAAGRFRGRNATFSIVNANEVSYPSAWPGSQIVYSYDRKDWRRCETRWDAASGHLSWTLAPAADVVWFAYFAPYSLEQHNDLIAFCAASPLAKVEEMGRSLDGRALDVVVAGEGQLKCWVIHRQHPGETQAEWFAEGLLER